MTKQLTDAVTFRHGATVANRIVQSPMQSHSGLENGFASEDTINHYARRSEVGGMIITEFHYVSETGGSCSLPGRPEQQAVYSDDHIEGLTKVADAIKKDGNKAILQIHHGGREASLRGLLGKDVYAPSAIDYDFLDYPVKGLTLKQIQDIIDDFGKATERAVKAGFDGVEIHGANHYLLQQFFSVLSNKRTDEYGGLLENRMRFPLEVTKKVMETAKAVAPDDFIIGYRVSPEEIHGPDVGYTYEESTQLIAEVGKLGLDYIHLSIFGKYSDGPKGVDKSYTELFREVLDDETKLLATGSVATEEDAKDALNYTDLVVIGRAALLNPEFGKLIEEGRGDEIATEMSPEQLKIAGWHKGLYDAYVDPNTSLPPIKNIESIR